MKKFQISFAGLILIVLAALSSSGGCNSSGDLCQLNFVELTNGPTEALQESEWECEAGGVVLFSIAFFSDGTGVRSDAGDFVWEQTGCKKVELETLELEEAVLDRIDGRIDTIGGVTVGSLTFRQTSDDLGDITVTCGYVELLQEQ